MNGLLTALMVAPLVVMAVFLVVEVVGSRKRLKALQEYEEAIVQARRESLLANARASAGGDL